MTAADVIGLYTELENLAIRIWLDGGWGVDALQGEQTRAHKDLEKAVQQNDVPKLIHFLESRGFKETRLEEARPWNFVLGKDFRDVSVLCKKFGIELPKAFVLFKRSS
jgi:lincosamide nucleotidyltransferase A/C/D/E